MKRKIDMSRVKVVRGGRPKLPGPRGITGKLLKRVDCNQNFGARLPVASPEQTERLHKMTRVEALALFEPLPIPASWTRYAEAPIGDVAAAMPGKARILRAALLLHELEIAQLAQRRTEAGTDYLIRRSFR